MQGRYGQGDTARRRAKKARSVSSPSSVPSYAGKRTFDTTPSELARFGVGSVRELVDTFNAYFMKTGGYPITQADYPDTRKKFEKLVLRWERLTSANSR